ncbi:MAG: DUF58 domain-containing protein [Candidatus Promineifilaceae bacterium]
MLHFDEATLRKLEQLSLVAHRVRAGVVRGERRSRKRGSSVEFADYRDYVQGDDLRRLDWNIYARLERPFIKLLEDEEDVAVHILVDASASMDWPDDGPTNKFSYGLYLAAGLGFIALAAGDQLGVALLRAERQTTWGPHRSRGRSLELLRFLDKAQAGGVTDLNHSLRTFGLAARRPGLLLLLSDLLSPAGYRAGLSLLQSRGHEIAILHLLSPDEVEPVAVGDVRLVDQETDAQTELTLDAASLGLYRRRLHEWRQEIAGYCRGLDIRYVPIVTDLGWDALLLQVLRQQGVLA